MHVDQHESHPSAPVLLEVERFQHISTGGERVLLRVDGRYGDRPGKRVLDAMLFVDDGLAVHRHAPVPDATDPGDSWLWRAAFEVPESYLTDARTRFALESDPGSLLDLPRPRALSHSSAIPVTARAAHIARRYAAAVAIVLTVAVAPGALPSQARTEVLRVHQADGSVIYMTTDGHTLGQLPPDAVIVDQGPAAPAAPAASPAQPQQPQPQPPGQPAPAQPPAQGQPAPTQPQPAQPPAQPQPAQPQTDPQMQAGRGLSNLAQSARNQGVGSTAAAPSGAGQQGPDRASGKRAAAQAGHAAKPAKSPLATPTGSSPAPQPARGPAPSMQHGSQQPGATPAQQAADVPTGARPLVTLPALVVATPSTLEPLDQINPPAATPNLPSDGLQPIDALGSSTAAGPAPGTPAPAPTGPAPSMQDAPPLFTPTTPAPASHNGSAQHHSGSSRHATAPKPPPSSDPVGSVVPKPPLRNPDGSPTTRNPTFFDALPGPAQVTGVPNFVIQKFQVPPFLLPIYQAAGIQYGIRWEVLAAINEIETDYGRNLNVSSAGALGWMQFMPSTWQMYGVDANRDGKRDPYNPVDAIFAAARYLKAAGGDKDIRKGIFAYNHAGWYVDSVMLRARLIAGYPPDLIGSLTGLTEARFPVAAHARYADDLTEQKALKRVQAGQNAANVVTSSATRRGIDIFAKEGAPVVAVNDGVIKAIGRSKDKGLYVVLQDVYGNRYTYSGLGSLARLYPVPKSDTKVNSKSAVQAIAASDPKPTAAASAGAQRPGVPAPKPSSKHAAPAKQSAIAAVKERLFAHPTRPQAQPHGGADQLLASQSGTGFATYDNYFSHAYGLNSRNATLKRLKKGSQVIGSTVLGRVAAGKPGAKASHVHFEIQPAGKGAPKIDPKPILDGWKLLESTAIYRAKGKNVLYGDGNFSIGQIMLLPKPLLEKRVLSDPRIDIYPAGRNDIKTGQIDRRVLIVLEYLAESGLKPTVSCLKSGHNLLTSSGNISEHSSGNAVDISAINGVSILGHQDAGGVTDQAVKRLMLLQGTIRPHQIISLLDFGQNTLALPDHANHIHVGFQPLFGSNAKLGREVQSVLKPGQWDNLVQRLGQIQNPTVPTQPSKYAIPVPGPGRK